MLLSKLLKTRIFTVFVLASAFLLVLNYLDQCLSIQDDGHVGMFVIEKHRFADCLLLAIPLFFMFKKRWVFSYVLVVYLYFIINLLYLRHYDTLMPMSSFLLFDNLSTLGPSVLSTLVLADAITLIPILAFVVYYIFYYKYTVQNKIKKRFKCIGVSVCLFIILFVTVPSYVLYNPSDWDYVTNLYKFEKLIAWRHFGFINYWVSSILNNGKPSDEKISFCDDFMDELFEEVKDLQPLTDAHNKNLIVIVVESFQSWPLDLKIDGVEITPNLNNLISDTATIYIPKVLPQVKGGRSSDAQLLINTGLFPINEGATTSLYSTNDFMGLPKALHDKGYNCLALFVDKKSFWSQGSAALSYGFDRIYDKLGFVNGEHTWVHMDEHLFSNALPVILSESEPFYALLTTYSGHDIFDESYTETPVRALNISDKFIKDVLNIYCYVDEQIGIFIHNLKSTGLYENSIIVITGDHDFVTLNRFENREEELLTDKFVPLIILNSPVDLHGLASQDQVIGQCDIYPTILDMMASDYHWRGFGKSVFRGVSGYAVYPDGRICGVLAQSASTSESQEARRFLDVSDIAIRSNYFKRKHDKWSN